MRDGSIGRTPNSRGRHLLYRVLILQETCDASPPVFHQLISSHQTSGDSDVIPKMAAELTPVLKEIYESKNFQRPDSWLEIAEYSA